MWKQVSVGQGLNVIIITADSGAVFSDEYVQQDPAESGRPAPWFYQNDADAAQPTSETIGDVFVRTNYDGVNDPNDDTYSLVSDQRNIRTHLQRYNREWVTACSSETYSMFGEANSVNRFGTAIPFGDHGQSNWREPVVGYPIDELDLDEAHYHWRYYEFQEFRGTRDYASGPNPGPIPFSQGRVAHPDSGDYAFAYPGSPWIPVSGDAPFWAGSNPRAPYWAGSPTVWQDGQFRFDATPWRLNFVHPRRDVRNTKSMMYLVNSPEARTVDFPIRLSYVWSINVQHSIYRWTYDSSGAAGSQWTRGARYELPNDRRAADAYAYDPAHHPGSPRVRTLPAGNVKVYSIPVSELAP